MNKLTALTTIPKDKSTPIKSLNAAQLAELQTALVKLGYPGWKNSWQMWTQYPQRMGGIHG